ncbi:MAG: cell division ATP-binding protein FtsE [Patescibacteria group bacterium]
MVKFEKVTKKFGDIVALRAVSFEIEPGEFVFITGPSGAGKTTIVKLILKEILPSEGKIEIDGTNLSEISSGELPKLRQKIGVVFQDFKLLLDRTVFENVALALEVTKKDRKEIEKKTREVLELVGLADRENLFPLQLAGGELQRTCLARAVVSNPKILIADEPTGNLDPSTSWQIVKLLKKINKMGTTVLMATHNVDIVDSMKERVIKLDKGEVIKDQTGGKYEPV